MNYSLDELNKELDAALVNHASYHGEMDTFLSYYLHSAYYARKSGQIRNNTDASNNLLRVYANMNINFTDDFPTIKVPTTGATQEQRMAASLREKILLSVWRKSKGEMLQRKWSKDGTLLTAAIAETGFDIENRCAFVKRYDPRYCFWQLAEGNEFRVVAFWAVVPITADEAYKKYGVRPRNLGVSNTSLAGSFLKNIDGRDWFFQATRWDGDIRVSWIGDAIVEEPHNHMMGGIPIDICFPFDNLDVKGRGGFYLEPLVPLQAKLNHTIERRDHIVERYSHPVTWGTGVGATQLDDLKEAMANGGFVGLKPQGQLGVLQLNEVKVLSEHENAIRSDMLRQSGFSMAAMGELAGANTSGDALGMYFTPTQRHIEHQYIAWKAFYESINTKILRATEKFAKTDEKFNISGYSPTGTILPMTDDTSKMQYKKGGFEAEFDPKLVIDGNYNSIVEFNPVTPKNEIEEKRLIMDMANTKVISRTTAFEKLGIESPEDELALLKQEQMEPALNPDGMKSAVDAQLAIQNSQQPPAAPAPVASEIQNVGSVQ